MGSMNRLYIVVYLLGVGETILGTGCGGTGRPSQPGPPPMLIGPEAVLLRTPDSVGHTSFEVSVAFSPDGKTVAAGRIEFSPEGERVPSSSTVVSLCDIASRRERITIRGPLAESCPVAFAPDGRTVAVGLDRAIKLYDPETGRERAELVPRTSYGPMCLAFSAEGGRLAASTQSGDVVVWETATRREVASLKAHTRSIGGVAISPDGRLLASASDGPIVCHPTGPFGLPPSIFGAVGVGCGPDHGIVRLFDMTTGKQIASLKHEWTARSVAFGPDGRFLASGGGGAARLWDLTTNRACTIVEAGADSDVYCMAFSPDGRTLAVGVGSRDFYGAYGEVKLWDMCGGRVRAVLKGEMGKVRSLSFAPDGQRLATGSREGIVLWSIAQTSPSRSALVSDPRSREF